MNIRCLVTGHSWVRDSHYQYRCKHCHDEPYDNLTLPEWILNLWRCGWPASVRHGAKRTWTWLRTRPCWVKDHDWYPYNQICQRCQQTGVEVAESGEWTWPEWKRLFPYWWRDRLHEITHYLLDRWKEYK